VGEAQGAQAGPCVGLVAAEIHRLLGRGPVVAEAVGLDHEAEVGPEEVDPVAAESTLRVWHRQAGVADDREEATLERVRRPTEGLRVKDPFQPTDPGTLRLFVKRRTEPMGADQVEPVRLVDGIFDLVVGQASREVDQDRDRVSHRDALDDSRHPELGSAVQTDPGEAVQSGVRHRHLDRPRRLRHDPPELSGAAVAEPSVRPARQRRRHQSPKSIDVGATDRVDPRPESVQPTLLEPRPDRRG
jgi:hypothetical protein